MIVKPYIKHVKNSLHTVKQYTQFYCVIVDSKSPKPQKPKKKENRVWEMGGTSSKDLDYSETNSNGSHGSQGHDNEAPAEPVRINFYPENKMLF